MCTRESSACSTAPRPFRDSATMISQAMSVNRRWLAGRAGRRGERKFDELLAHGVRLCSYWPVPCPPPQRMPRTAMSCGCAIAPLPADVQALARGPCRPPSIDGQSRPLHRRKPSRSSTCAGRHARQRAGTERRRIVPAAIVLGTAAEPRIRALGLPLAAARRRRLSDPQRDDRRQAGHRHRGQQRRRRVSMALRADLRGCERGQPTRARSTSPSAPKLKLRMLDHWDNLDRHVERGYAGQSIWDWWKLPGHRRPALHRLCPRQRLDRHQRRGRSTTSTPRPTVLTAPLHRQGRGAGRRVPALRHPRLSLRALLRADRARRPARPPIRSTRRCAPGGRPRPTRSTAPSPISAASWSRPIRKASPGPQDYHRTHADGANMLAARGGAARRHRDVARLRLFARTSPRTAPSRPTTSSSRSTASSPTTSSSR